MHENLKSRFKGSREVWFVCCSFLIVYSTHTNVCAQNRERKHAKMINDGHPCESLNLITIHMAITAAAAAIDYLTSRVESRRKSENKSIIKVRK